MEARHRIIKRPRLTRLLDESAARVIMLVAPAGYGKTILAREWLDGKRHAWYEASPPASDVAALAFGLAAACARIEPRVGKRMRVRLRALSYPERDVQRLAEFLAEDLSAWKNDTWLAIDDYHFACESKANYATSVGSAVET